MSTVSPEKSRQGYFDWHNKEENNILEFPHSSLGWECFRNQTSWGFKSCNVLWLHSKVLYHSNMLCNNPHSTQIQRLHHMSILYKEVCVNSLICQATKKFRILYFNEIIQSITLTTHISTSLCNIFNHMQNSMKTNLMESTLTL